MSIKRYNPFVGLTLYERRISLVVVVAYPLMGIIVFTSGVKHEWKVLFMLLGLALGIALGVLSTFRTSAKKNTERKADSKSQTNRSYAVGRFLEG